MFFFYYYHEASFVTLNNLIFCLRQNFTMKYSISNYYHVAYQLIRFSNCRLEDQINAEQLILV